MIGRAALAGLAAGMLALSSAAPGQDLSPELQALDAQLPGTLINDPTSLGWATQGASLKTKGVKDAAIPGGGAANQFEVKQAGPQPYAAQAFIPLLSKISKGETLTIGFYARTVTADTADGKGVIGVRFQQNADPWPGFGEAVVKAGPEWEWHEVSGISNDFAITGTASATDLTVRAPQGINSWEDFIQSLLLGNVYMNVHSTANTGGEIRGQVIRVQ